MSWTLELSKTGLLKRLQKTIEAADPPTPRNHLAVPNLFEMARSIVLKLR